MPNVCIACVKPLLKNPSSRVSFHVFPTCPKKRQVWINRCKLTNKEVLPNHKLCSFHFELTCFKSNVKRRILYPDAIPTIFETSHVKRTNLSLKMLKGKSKNCIKFNNCILCVKSAIKYPSSKISLHLFPACPKRRQVWLNNCKLTNQEVLPNRKICSFHFEPTCFKSTERRRILYSNAVPTIFGNGLVTKKNLSSKIVKGRSKDSNIEITCQKRQCHNISLVKVGKEVFEHVKSIATNRKREFDELGGAVTKLKSKKSSFMSVLKLVRIQISLGNKIK
ncbi:uncharacterized protein LOC113558688 [Rhopalosiphum maidis]|uniref:uncharacterized protein LOC113558688 n=1 Tax=Rhopalosiphum maidis TaxID=43146 RepID=UPI000EFE6AFF|nr:uncharacterized protein LOC113558688 [Rhopalosiphum maidis]